MRKPRPADYDPRYRETHSPKPEEVDLSGVVAIKPRTEATSEKPQKETKPKSNRDATQSRNRDTTVSRYHDTTIEIVRKSVKEFGKEAATHRFTIEEKQKIADLVYAYKRRGIRTSENEITRIAVNFVIKDHSKNGENSILDLVLKALNE